MRVDYVLADRGFGTIVGDQALDAHAIKRSVIPRRGRAAPAVAPEAGGGATASATAWKDASPSSNVRDYAAREPSWV